MWTAARRTAVLISFLAGCAGIVGEPERDYAVTPVTGDDGSDDGGTAAGGDSGVATTGGTGDATTGDTATGGTAGAVTDAGLPGATGGTGGATSGGTTGTSGTAGASGTAGTNGSGSGGTNGVDAGPTTGGSPGPVTPPGSQTDPCDNGTEALTKGLRIREIALYQTVKVPLMTGGSWLSTRNAPVVQGKKALVRAFVDTLSGYTSHAVKGVLTLDNDGAIKELISDVRPTAASTDGALPSSFNFDVEPVDIGANTKLSVSLVDPTCTNALGSASDARFPASGTQLLDAAKIGKLRVVVVPVTIGQYQPDTSATQLKNMRDSLLAQYPVADVEITLRAQGITGPSTLSQQGWSNVLNQVLNARRTDRPPSDVYYYGIVAPSSSFSTYCRSSCLLGLAPLVTRVSPDQQGGLGVGFLDVHTPDTMVHELGHAHGRAHAPCGGVSGADGSFPYSGGGIGAWGWDSRNNTLQSPSNTKDVMGYCNPTWMSDYTYKALATRSASVNLAPRVSLGSGPDWHSVMLYGDGNARWGGMVTKDLPGGDIETALALDAAGKVVTEVEVVRVAFDHADDALLYIPEPEPGWVSLQLSDRTLSLLDVADAL